jgi:hypothetical protein
MLPTKERFPMTHRDRISKEFATLLLNVEKGSAETCLEKDKTAAGAADGKEESLFQPPSFSEPSALIPPLPPEPLPPEPLPPEPLPPFGGGGRGPLFLPERRGGGGFCYFPKDGNIPAMISAF